MKQYHRHIKSVLFLLGILFSSCTSDLDFNQVNTLKLEPKLITNLTSFDIKATEFVINGVEQNSAYDAQIFNDFTSTFFKNNLKRVDFFFEVTNTINRAFTIDLLLMDANDQPLYTIHFDVPASTGVPIIITKDEIFERAKLNLLFNTVNMGFSLKMAPGPALDENSLGSLKIRSSATIYLEIQ